MPALECIRRERVTLVWRNIEKIALTSTKMAESSPRKFDETVFGRNLSEWRVFFRNGQEWWRLRSEFQKGLSSPQQVKHFLPFSDEITKEFVKKIKVTAADDDVKDFLPELARLNLEMVCLMAFDVRMNSLSEEERHPKSRTSRLIDAAEVTNSCLLPLDQGLPLWKLFETPTYKKLRVSQQYIERFPRITIFR